MLHLPSFTFYDWIEIKVQSILTTGAYLSDSPSLLLPDNPHVPVPVNCPLSGILSAAFSACTVFLEES